MNNEIKLKTEKLFCVIDSGYNRCSLWFKTKAEAQLTCDNFNEHVHEDHTVAEFAVVPAIKELE